MAERDEQVNQLWIQLELSTQKEQSLLVERDELVKRINDITAVTEDLQQRIAQLEIESETEHAHRTKQSMVDQKDVAILLRDQLEESRSANELLKQRVVELEPQLAHLIADQTAKGQRIAQLDEQVGRFENEAKRITEVCNLPALFSLSNRMS
jgi:chromosome segregation ATPase